MTNRIKVLFRHREKQKKNLNLVYRLSWTILESFYNAKWIFVWKETIYCNFVTVSVVNQDLLEMYYFRAL